MERLQKEAFYWRSYQKIQDTQAWNVKAFCEAKFFKQTLNVSDIKSLKAPSQQLWKKQLSWGKIKKRIKMLQHGSGPSSSPGSGTLKQRGTEPGKWGLLLLSPQSSLVQCCQFYLQPFLHKAAFLAITAVWTSKL